MCIEYLSILVSHFVVTATLKALIFAATTITYKYIFSDADLAICDCIWCFHPRLF